MTNNGTVTNKENDVIGHRRRLKERFMKAALRSLPDYEILELILFSSIVRRDTKPLAKKLLSKFGSLIAVISADPVDLLAVAGVSFSVVLQMKIYLDLLSRLHLPPDLKNINVLNSWTSVLNYCSLTMGFKAKEHFRILFLNKRNILIADEILDSGTVDKVNVYPRELVKQSLYHNASAVILIHNHPSGEAKPSRDDLEITQKIVGTLATINVSVHDHVIVAHHAHFSFRGNGLL
jgi:DNA repair protein RadC